MASREWKRHSIEMGGQRINVHTIRCSNFPTCRVSCDMPDRGDKQIPADQVEKRFVRKGWFVGASEKHDLCPECAADKVAERRARRAPRATNLKLVSDQGAPIMTALTTAELPKMSREDKRIINAKLHEVYDDKGYISPWTDLKVAEYLGCPAAWVRDIRDELFGDDAGNAEIKEFLTQAEQAKADAGDLLNKIEGIADRVRKDVASLGEITAAVKDMRRHLDTLNVTATRIAKAVNA